MPYLGAILGIEHHNFMGLGCSLRSAPPVATATLARLESTPKTDIA